jgi:hypothetical protein
MVFDSDIDFRINKGISSTHSTLTHSLATLRYASRYMFTWLSLPADKLPITERSNVALYSVWKLLSHLLPFLVIILDDLSMILCHTPNLHDQPKLKISSSNKWSLTRRCAATPFRKLVMEHRFKAEWSTYATTRVCTNILGHRVLPLCPSNNQYVIGNRPWIKLITYDLSSHKGCRTKDSCSSNLKVSENLAKVWIYFCTWKPNMTV